MYIKWVECCRGDLISLSLPLVSWGRLLAKPYREEQTWFCKGRMAMYAILFEGSCMES